MTPQNRRIVEITMNIVTILVAAYMTYRVALKDLALAVGLVPVMGSCFFMGGIDGMNRARKIVSEYFNYLADERLKLFEASKQGETGPEEKKPS